MIQFNLLPDVKLEYIRTRYRKRLIMAIASVSSAVCFLIFILLFLFVRVNQPKHMRDLTKDIESNASTIQKTQDIDKILTIQNQLNSLPALHEKKLVSSRMISYLTQVTPSQATISNVDIDFDASTMRVKGQADSLSTINKYADTLKFTDYKINKKDGPTGKAFKNVVLQSFSVSNQQLNATSYELAFSFDPAIFAQVTDSTSDTGEDVVLNVPKIISTRSETEKPADLFVPQPGQQDTGEDKYMARQELSLKQLAINKDNASIVIVVGIAAFVIVFSLVASNALLKQRSYQARVIKQKKIALDQVKSNVQEVEKLKTSYKAFADANQNVLGGSANGNGDKDGDNPRIVLDALPSKYDFPALATSLDKIFKPYGIESITGVDEEITQGTAATPTGTPVQPIEIPFSITISAGADSTREALLLMEQSIRPIQVKTLNIAGATGTSFKVTATGKTYYQPQIKFEVKKEVVR